METRKPTEHLLAPTAQEVDESSRSTENNLLTHDTPEDITTRAKKRKADKDNWKKNINKNKRAKGEAYLGRTYEKGSSKYTVSEKPAKQLKRNVIVKLLG